MTSFRIALWVGLKSVACLCMLPEEPPTGPDAPPSPSNDGTLAIQVVGPDDATIEEAVVDLWRVRDRLRLEGEDGFRHERRTAQELGKGNYRFDRPPPGSYSIRVRAAGFATGWSHWDVH